MEGGTEVCAGPGRSQGARPELADLVAVTPEAVPGKTHTAPVPLFSSGAETATCPPTNAVRLPKRSPFSAASGTPGVFWPINVALAANPFAVPRTTPTKPPPAAVLRESRGGHGKP